MTQGLIIPVDVQAHCATSAGRASSGFLCGTADFSAVPYCTDPTNLSTLQNNGPYTSDSVLATKTVANWDAGVHLHWTLPDALLQGAHDNTAGETVFPPVPNRWLVTRIVVRSGGVVPNLCQSWVIESDQLSVTCPHERPHGPPAVTVPVQPSDYKAPDVVPAHAARGQSFQYLGNFSPYASWQEGLGAAYLYQQSATAPYKLTAVCYGNPVFAGFYPDCSTVFGFLDQAEDLQGVQATDGLAYHVVGWYCQAAASDDPVPGAISLPAPCPAPTADDLANNDPAAQAYAQFLDSGLQKITGEWSYFEESKWLFTRPDAGNTVQYSLYSGLVENISWDPKRSYITDTSQTKNSVAIGNTAAEAIAALVASSIGDPESEDLLNALQVGALAEYCQPSKKAAYEAALHRSYFGSDQGGTLWQVSRTGSADPSEITLPDAQAAALNTLNTLQLATDDLQSQIDQLGRQLFLDWYKYQVFMRTPEGDLQNCDPDVATLHQSPDDARTFIQTEVANLGQAAKQLQDNAANIQSQVAALRGSIDSAYELISVPAPKFWRANEPVILMTGELIQPIVRYGGDGRLRADGYLECRLSTEIVPSSAYTLGSNASLPHAGDIAALVAEAVLQATGGMPSLAPAGKKLPSEIGVTRWQSNPWLPLMMEWQVGYWPAQEIPPQGVSTTYATDLVTAHYAFNSASTDLSPKDTTQATTSYTYTNRTILSDHPGTTLKTLLQATLENPTNLDPTVIATLQKAQDQIKPLDVLAQTLGGFNEGLLMTRQVLQLGVSDPGARTPPERTFWAQCATVLQNTLYNDVAPHEDNNFGPIRAGYMQWTGIKLIDAFGQRAEVNMAPPIVAASLKPTDPTLTKEGLISLVPRLTQPSRFLFDWISAASDQVELNNLPAASPICGWVLFNHLDNSLVIYNTDGGCIGSFILDQTGKRAIWQGAPGTAGYSADFSASLEDAFQGQNEYLGKLALGIQKNGASYLEALLQTLDAGLSTIVAPGAAKDPSTAVLISRPLALVRASLTLDLKGGPAVSQSWDAFVAAAAQGDPTKRSTAQFQDVQFPALLGNVSDAADGLVGYFTSDDYTHFYSAAAAAAQNPGVTLPAWDTVLVDGSGSPVEISMLIDPRACVHAMIGIAPIQTLQVPPDQISRALGRMNVTFLTAPILSGAPTALPVPKESGGQWSWLTLNGSNAWTTSTIAKVNASQTQSYSPQQIIEGWLNLTSSERKTS